MSATVEYLVVLGRTHVLEPITREKVRRGYGRIGLIAPTAGDARDVMVEGSSGPAVGVVGR